MLKKALNNTELSDRTKNTVIVLVYIVTIVIVAMIWNAFFFSPLKVAGNSMNPSLTDGDVVIINKISGNIERYDMVVFPYKYDNRRNLIKRVIGLPGEKIEIINGKIYVNDEKLEEYYGIYDENGEDMFKSYGPIILGDTQYFVLGDNRYNSDDSRSDNVGPVEKSDIIGRVVFRLWPFNSIGSMENQ